MKTCHPTQSSTDLIFVQTPVGGVPWWRSAGRWVMPWAMLGGVLVDVLAQTGTPEQTAPFSFAPKASPPTGAEKGLPLSMNFQNIELRTALQVMADFTGLNVVVSDSVTGQVTVRFKDVPWELALDSLLQAKGLAYQRQGSVLWVATQAEISAREKKNLEARQAMQAIEPLQTRAFELSYARANEVLASCWATQQRW
jgi:type II secretory pathway component HofQ